MSAIAQPAIPQAQPAVAATGEELTEAAADGKAAGKLEVALAGDLGQETVVAPAVTRKGTAAQVCSQCCIFHGHIQAPKAHRGGGGILKKLGISIVYRSL